MTDYGHELRFGTFLTPQNADSHTPVALAVLTEEVGLDLVTFQDHPYQPSFLDTWTLLSWVAARTERVHLSGLDATSVAGLVGAPGMAAYSTTKFALVGFAEALRHEIAAKGIDVTVVCPGRVHTNLHRATRYGNLGFRRFLDGAPAWYGVTKERAARLIVRAMARRQPLVVFGGEKLGWWLKRVWPTGGLAAAGWMARRLQLIGAHDE